MAERLNRFSSRYHPHFQLVTRSVMDPAGHYLRGLFQATKKNMERMEEAVPEADYEQVQHFLSESPWSSAAVMKQVAQDADRLLGGRPDSSFLIDESGFTKKGTHSVGVARQYNGRLGKIDNCQVGVFATLSSGTSVCPVDVRLYLPKEWTQDAARCRGAGIPVAQRRHRTKQVLALEMVQAARQAGLRFAWVQGDGAYGHDLKFCQALADQAERFVVGVHKTQRIYLEDPQPAVPAKAGVRGRRRTRPQTQARAITVEEWRRQQPPEAWQPLVLRDTTKGELEVEVLHQWVWVWDGKSPQARRWRLIVQRDAATPSEYKYAWSNAGAEVGWETVARQHGQRYWIERAFEDGKGQVGLGDYQVRGWRAWHHHMAMVMMAMLFMVEERQTHQTEVPLLSCTDVVELLCYALPRRKSSAAELLRQMRLRHAKRQASIEGARRRQRARRTKRQQTPRKT